MRSAVRDPRTRRLILGAATLALVFGPTSGAASAIEPTNTGWWTSLAAGPLGQAAGPDVPPGGILVQAGPASDAPIAYGAVRYELGPGQEASTLTLRLAPGALSTPDAIRLCALTVATFEDAEGGSLDDAPAYDPADCVEVLEASGSYVADLSGSMSRGADGVLALAVVPGQAGRVVLDPPDDESLQTATSTDRSTGGTPSSGGPGAPGTIPPAPSTATGAASGSSPRPAVTVPSLSSGGASVGSSGASAGPLPAAAPSGDTEAVAAGPVAGSVPASSSAPSANDWAPFGFFMLVLAGGTAWGMASRSAALGGMAPAPVPAELHGPDEAAQEGDQVGTRIESGL
jgi:hypothetical protein